MPQPSGPHDGQALVVEYFSRIDGGDLVGAAALFCEDGTFLGARGRSAIWAVMERGLAPNAGVRSRHVAANVATHAGDGLVVVRYSALAYTMAADGPPVLRTLLDQEMRLRPQPGGSLLISDLRIYGLEASGGGVSWGDRPVRRRSRPSGAARPPRDPRRYPPGTLFGAPT